MIDAFTARVEPGKPAPMGAYRVVVIADDAASFGRVRASLAPLAATLLRAKIVVQKKYLLPLTIPQQPADWPQDAPKSEHVVGARRITRLAAAPALRMAQLALEPGQVRLALESDSPRGREIDLAALRDSLRKTEPAVDTFTLLVSDDTPWREVVGAVVAAACYDRAAGDEPHEIVLATRLAK
jgi:hypothetical protein